jgi:hypothetical protein
MTLGAEIIYKKFMIVNDTSRVIRMKTQLGASLTDDSRSIIYHCNMFKITAFRNVYLKKLSLRLHKIKLNYFTEN